jgi:hypothetical protein
VLDPISYKFPQFIISRLCPNRRLNAKLLARLGVAAAVFIPAAKTALSIFAWLHLAAVMVTVGDGSLIICGDSSSYHFLVAHSYAGLADSRTHTA